MAWPPAAPQRAAALARSLHAWVFERSGLTRRIQALSDGAGGTLDQRLAGAGAGVFDDGGEGWQLAILGLYFFGVRLICVAALAPLLAGAYLLGFIDGLVARAIRIAGAGRESASLYHRAKWVLAVVGAGAPACYLALPFALPLAASGAVRRPGRAAARALAVEVLQEVSVSICECRSHPQADLDGGPVSTLGRQYGLCKRNLSCSARLRCADGAALLAVRHRLDAA